MQLLWFNHPMATDSAIVGGKAAMLARLAPRYRVPPGFCLVWPASDHPLPVTSQQTIAAAYAQLIATAPAVGIGVAVRSSAVDEDGSSTSFAGQHETVLNVTNLAQLLAAIEQCRASARSPQALAYRRNHGLTIDEIPFAVLVQSMVVAESSVVAFSVDPVSGQRDQLVINAGRGLGVALMGEK